jgi:hypothetical protein
MQDLEVIVTADGIPEALVLDESRGLEDPIGGPHAVAACKALKGLRA